MPSPAPSIPEKLKPYIGYGVDLNYSSSDKNAVGDCPFCHGSDSFSVEIETGRFKCWKCDIGLGYGSNPDTKGGGLQAFIRVLHDESYEATTSYEEIATELGLKYPTTPMEWGLSKSLINQRWLVPGYGIDGTVYNLYKWTPIKKGDSWKKRLLCGAGLNHQLHGVPLFDKSKEVVDLCEGFKDGMLWWEYLATHRDEGETITANRSASLLADRNVLAIAGCESFHPSWAPLFADKVVNILFDNDHPKVHPRTGETLPPAGSTGAERIARILYEERTPQEVNILNWGSKEKLYSESLPSGYDLGDLLQETMK